MVNRFKFNSSFFYSVLPVFISLTWIIVGFAKNIKRSLVAVLLQSHSLFNL